ncbi:hypothetical protein [Streptomyces sp. NBC_01530]|uniref:hypothetical protein n=1 Tax=Streptomyces sp. NBC_01530 TaxID=2903895 RepID=UPI003867BBB0
MGADLEHAALTIGDVTTQQLRAAAVHCADQIAAEHPHPLDPLMPRLAGRLIAQDPAVNAGVLELLAALGIRPEQIGRPS